MNGALWGQRDLTHTCGFVASLFYILEKRLVAALVAFGVSCSLKAQAMFWLPFLIASIGPRLNIQQWALALRRQVLKRLCFLSFASMPRSPWLSCTSTHARNCN